MLCRGPPPPPGLAGAGRAGPWWVLPASILIDQMLQLGQRLPEDKVVTFLIP